MSDAIDMREKAGGAEHLPLSRRLRADVLLLGAALMLCGATGAGIYWSSARSGPDAGGRQAAAPRVPQHLEELSVDNADQIVVEGQEAQVRNAALPMDKGPLERAQAFTVAEEESTSGHTALKCMTQAIYYEAANEPVQGRRAVAQVVLNRVRHPAYPNSVCGVVYQGSQRRTGCQFSFTCDGSLLRTPSIGAWRAAEAIAKAALEGEVEPSVGTSTHYHADYVLPKWAFTLGKIQQIGRHIFYRFRGNAGSAGAFRARYAGNEYIPALDFAALRLRAQEDGAALAEADFAPGLTVAPHVTDRHASNDVGGRLDTRKEWRLSIPDPVAASGRLNEVVAQSGKGAEALAEPAVIAEGRVAVADPLPAKGIKTP